MAKRIKVYRPKKKTGKSHKSVRNPNAEIGYKLWLKLPKKQRTSQKLHALQRKNYQY